MIGYNKSIQFSSFNSQLPQQRIIGNWGLCHSFKQIFKENIGIDNCKIFKNITSYNVGTGKDSTNPNNILWIMKFMDDSNTHDNSGYTEKCLGSNLEVRMCSGVERSYLSRWKLQ